MKRFFLLFIGIQLVLFGLELLKPVQEHVVVPFTTQLARFCSALISTFDSTAIASAVPPAAAEGPRTRVRPSTPRPR